MKPVDEKSRTYIDSSKWNNNKDPKFKFAGIVRMQKYKKYFCKRLHSNLVGKSFYDLKN